MAAMVGIGREISAAATGLKDSTMERRRLIAADLEPAVRAHGKSKPLEKNLPLAVVMRTEPGVD